MQTESFYDRADILIGKWVIEYDNDERLVETRLYADSSELCTRVIHKYDARGREVELRSFTYLPDEANSLTDRFSLMISEWIDRGPSWSIYKYQYDNQGHLVKITAETHYSDAPDTALKIIDNKYDDKGQMVETRQRSTGGWESDPLKITGYKYDSKGNKIKEVLYDNASSSQLSEWYNDGKPMTTKTLFRYDDHNNLVETKEYFIGGYNYEIATAEGKYHSGTLVGGGSIYNYDTLGNKTTYTYYKLYREDDASEAKDIQETRKIKITESKERKESVEYDKQGNIVKKMSGNVVDLTRDIEYFK